MVRKDRCAKVNVSWRYFSIRNYYLRILCFMFHFLSLMCWFSIIIRGETYSFDVSFYVSCFILCFMFHFSKYWGSDLSLPLCSWISPSVFLNLSLSVFESLPQCFWIAPSVFFLRWNIETKSETLVCYVSWRKDVDNQCIMMKKWNMKHKNSKGKIYVSERNLFRAFWKK